MDPLHSDKLVERDEHGVIDVRCHNCGKMGTSLSTCVECGAFLSITLELSMPDAKPAVGESLTERLRDRAWKHRQHRQLRGEAADRIEELEHIATDALEFIEQYEDVKDGSDGRPQANRAMHLAGELRRLLGVTK